MPPVQIGVQHDSDREVQVVALSRRSVIVGPQGPLDAEINPGGNRGNWHLEVDGPGADQCGSRKLPSSGAMEEGSTKNFPQRAARSATILS